METKQGQRNRGSQRDYSLAFKLQVVSEVEKGELTYKLVQKKYVIQGRSTVLVWIRKQGMTTKSTIKKMVEKNLETFIFRGLIYCNLII